MRAVLLIGVIATIHGALPGSAVAQSLYANLAGWANVTNATNMIDQSLSTYAVAQDLNLSNCPNGSTPVTVGTPPLSWQVCRITIGSSNYDFNSWTHIVSTTAFSQGVGLTAQSAGSGASVGTMVFTRRVCGAASWNWKDTFYLSSFFPSYYGMYSLPASGSHLGFPCSGQMLIARLKAGPTSTRELRWVELDRETACEGANPDPLCKL